MHVAGGIKALYDLGNRIAGFDFFPWLVMQARVGATEIVFNTRNPSAAKWPRATVMRRFESILRPGPALLGLKCSIGDVGDPDFAPYHQSELTRLCRAGATFRRLKSVLPPGRERYTVTLRRTERSPDRNSSEADWRVFAGEIGAKVIPDYEDEPIHLHERMALYAGAEMNFFVTNGPAMLCFLSEYPAMQFGCNPEDSTKAGLRMGSALPWLLPQHRQVFEPAELPVIRRHFAEWREVRP
jgi:hypothetical protein